MYVSLQAKNEKMINKLSNMNYCNKLNKIVIQTRVVNAYWHRLHFWFFLNLPILNLTVIISFEFKKFGSHF